jgi:pimeloyl-ACP methyl ester carboxylesterase
MDFDYVVMPAVLVVIAFLVIWAGIRRIRFLRARNYRAWRRVTERVLLSIIILLFAVAAGSSAFNAIALQVARSSHPPQGAFYSVNGARMHINCMGAGSPTIVLDSGYDDNALTWEDVQPALSKTTRVCSYDRAGSGWSEMQPEPRDADHIASQLHELLRQANVSGPIVLMGHSIAGMYVRAYATRYPADVVGIVFVDGSSPEQFHNPLFTEELGKQPWLLYRGMSILGIPRIMWMLSLSSPELGGHASKVEAEATFQGHVAPLKEEMDNFVQSADETIHTGPYGWLPILIFTQDTDHPSKDMAQFAGAWNQMQENLKRLSTRSRRIIAKGSGHYIQFRRPDLIEKEVPPFIEQIRGTAPQPTKYGTTTTE